MRVLSALRALLSARKFVAGVGAVALTVLLGVVAFALAAGSDEKAEVARAQAGLGAVPSGEEVPSLRTEHSRSYRQPDGSLKTKMGLEAVNYRAADGKWKPVDTTLRRTAAGVENAAGALQVRLPDRAEQSAVRVQRGDAWVSFALRGAKGASALSKNTARYANVLPGVSLKYEMGGSSVKETIVLASAKAPSSYTFDVKAADGLTPKVSPSREIEFRDATGRRQLTWAAPWMKDAAGQISRAVKYVVDPAAGGWTVRVVADQRWLQDKDRRFPVEIDPTTYFGVGKVCEIASGSLADTSNCTTSEMSVNVGRENGRVHRALVAFDESEIRSVIGDDALVTSADFFYYWTTSNPDTVELDVHQLTRSFTPAATWNTYDGTNGWTYGGGDGNPDRESRQTMYSDWVNGWVGLGVGRLVQGWLDGSIENHGIGVIPADDGIDRIDNLDGLGLVIESRPKTGADPRATFEQIQPTATSKAKVNVANGNLVLTETDLTSGSGTSSIAVERTINSLGDLATSTFGSGWVPRYGAETTLWQHWVDRSYILEGPGGLAGRFHRKPDGTYDPPPGWNASLVENNDWTITVTFHDTGEAWDFDTSDPRRLTKITRGSYEIDLTYGDNGIVTLTDSDDNEITYIYDEQSGQLQSVGDGTTSRQYTLTDGKLLAIAPPNATGVEYAYDTNGRVEQVTYPGGSRLTVAYDPNGRVTSLTQKPDDNPTNDQTTTFAYSSPTSPCQGTDLGQATVLYPGGQSRTYCYGRDGAVRLSSPVESSDITDPTLTLSGKAWEDQSDWHREGDLPLSVFAADAHSGIKTVTTTVNGVVVDSATQPCAAGGCTSQRDMTLQTGALGDGVHGVDVVVSDQADRTASAELEVKVDGSEPTSTIGGTLWAERGSWFGDSPESLTVAASDSESGTRSIELLVDGVREVLESEPCLTGGCDRTLQASLDTGALGAGEHQLRVVVTDEAGNAHVTEWEIEVDVEGPEVDLGGALWLERATPLPSNESRGLMAAATDGAAGATSLEILIDSTLIGTASDQCPTGGCSLSHGVNIAGAALDSGAHSVEVTARDAVGNETHVEFDIEVADVSGDGFPNITLGGALVGLNGAPVHGGTYSLDVAASPGGNTPGHGVVDLRVTPSEGPERRWTQSCAASCGMAREFPFESDRFSEGLHQVRVEALDAEGRSTVDALTVRVDREPPKPPSRLTGQSTQGGITLQWAPGEANELLVYNVYRSASSAGPWTRISEQELSETTWTDQAPLASGTNFYAVRAQDADGTESPSSAPLAIATTGASIPAPDAPLARSHERGLSLIWNAVAGADKYAVYRGKAGAAGDHVATVEKPHYLDDSVEPTETYEFRVRAIDSSGHWGPMSAPVGAAGFGSDEDDHPVLVALSGHAVALDAAGDWHAGNEVQLTAEATPTNTAVDPPGVTSMTVTIDDQVVANESQSCTSGGCALLEEFVLDLSQIADGTHSVVVTATDEEGDSAEASVTLRLDRGSPAMVENVEVQEVGSEIVVSWEPNYAENIAGYEVLRASANEPFRVLTRGVLPTAAYSDVAPPATGEVRYVVRAVSHRGVRGPDSGEAVIERGALMPAPGALTATPGVRSVSLSWPSVQAAAHYTVYRRLGNGSWDLLTRVDNGTTYVDTAVRADNEYSYYVVAVGAAGHASAPSSVATATPDWGEAAPQVQLAGTLVDTAGTWLSTGTYGITAVATEAAVLGGSPGVTAVEITIDDQVIASVSQPCPLGGCSLSASAQVDASELAEGQHSVMVHATDAGGRVTTASTGVQIDRGGPDAPTSLTADADADAIALAWAPSNARDILGYTVERATTRTGAYDIVESSIPEPEYTDSSAAPTQTYWYRVRGTDVAGNVGAASAPVSATRASAAARRVEGVTATGHLGRVELAWSPVATEDLAGYRVYASDTADGELQRISGATVAATEFIDTEGEPGYPRYYAIRAVNERGDTGPQSDVVAATPADLADRPGGAPLVYRRYNVPGAEAGGSNLMLATENGIPGQQLFECTPRADDEAAGTTPGTCAEGGHALGPDGRTVAYVDDSQTLSIFDSQGLTHVCGPLFLLAPRATPGCAGASLPWGTPGDPHPVWAAFDPSGDRLYYSASEGAGPGDIWRMGTDGTNRQLVLAAAGDVGYVAPAITADGSTLYVTKAVVNASAPDLGLVAVDIATGGQSEIDVPVDYAAYGAPSPSGRRIAFYSFDQSGWIDVYVSRSDGSDARRLMTMPEQYQTPPLSWSPNGKHILVDMPGSTTGMRNIVRLSPAGGSAEVLGSVPTDMQPGGTSVAPMYAQAALPSLSSSLPAGGLFTQGNQPLAISANAESGGGVSRLAIVVGEESTVEASDCVDGCPSDMQAAMTVPLDEFEEGTHVAQVLAKSGLGVRGVRRSSVVVDRTRPVADFALTNWGDQWHLDFDDVRDALLADGTPGSGIDQIEYRVQDATGWSPWTVASPFGAATLSAATAVSVQVRVRDRAGNMTTSWRRPPVASLLKPRCKLKVDEDDVRIVHRNADKYGDYPEREEIRVDVQINCATGVGFITSATTRSWMTIDGNVVPMRVRGSRVATRDDQLTDLPFGGQYPDNDQYKKLPKGSLVMYCGYMTDGGTKTLRISAEATVYVAEAYRPAERASTSVEVDCPDKESDRIRWQAAAFHSRAHYAWIESSPDQSVRKKRGPSNWLRDGEDGLGEQPWPPKEHTRNAWAAHHLIPTGEPFAREVRAMAYRCALPPNHRINGIFLRASGLERGGDAYEQRKWLDARTGKHYHQRVFHADTQFDAYGRLLKQEFRDALPAGDWCEVDGGQPWSARPHLFTGLREIWKKVDHRGRWRVTDR